MDIDDLSAQTRLRQQQRYQKEQELIKQQSDQGKRWRFLGTDANTQQGFVTDGSIVKAGKIVTNGYIVPGQSIQFSEAGGRIEIDAQKWVRPQPQVLPRKTVSITKKLPSIAILFEASIDGGNTFGLYVGGLDAVPVEIDAINGLSTEAYFVDNTGNGTYKVTASFPDTGIIGEWVTDRIDLKISPPTGRPENVVSIDRYVGSGYFASYSSLSYTVINGGSFHAGEGNLADGTFTSLWETALIVGGVKVQSQLMTGTYTQAATYSALTVSGNLALPDGGSVPLSLSDTLSENLRTLSYVTGEVLFVENQNNSIYVIESLQSVTSKRFRQYYWRRNGASTLIAEAEGATSSPTSPLVSISGNPLEIEAQRSVGRLVGNSLYRVVIDRQTFDQSTGLYTVQSLNLEDGTTETLTVQAKPIPANYTIRKGFSFFGSFGPNTQHIWNASFNFEKK